MMYNIPSSAPEERQRNIYAPPDNTLNLNKLIHWFELIGGYNWLFQ